MLRPRKIRTIQEINQDLLNKQRYYYIGNLIRTLRKEKGWTQIELAQKAGINHSIISRIEYSQPPKSCSLATLFKIADAFEIEPADLIPKNSIAAKEGVLNIEDDVDVLGEFEEIEFDEDFFAE